ncbi:MAG: CTP synthase (glutamine hydrolyzing) [archaeon]
MDYKETNDIYSQAIDKKLKFVIITGGVLSGIGKGVSASSIALLLDNDLKKIPIKCDGYLNFDPGTMNPVEHGEVFVLDDGTEVDMDFGHYERYLDISCNGSQNLTMGKIYKEIIDLERSGAFLGKTVKLIPEVTNYIEYRVIKTALDNDANIVLLEIGGTVGDLENELYITACKGIRRKLGKENVFFVHLAYVPEIAPSDEQKTKPAQNSIAELLKRGIIPDAVICRAKRMLDKKAIEKLTENCALLPEQLISGCDVKNIYEIPINFKNQKLDKLISKKLKINTNLEFDKFIEAVKKIETGTKEKIVIGICGKYTGIDDSYASVIEALHHAKTTVSESLEIRLIDTEKYEEDGVSNSPEIKELDGIIVPGGFGARGINGKLNIIRYARENNVPYLGLCYGMQLAVIEYARNVCGLPEAHTTEIDKDCKEPIVTILPGQENKKIGGSMRLGSCVAELQDGSQVAKIYGKNKITERHRHRYEVNPKYHSILKEKGLVLCGMDPTGELLEFIEIKKHPFFIGTQAHPELKSKLLTPHPLFVEFVKKAKEKKEKEK